MHLMAPREDWTDERLDELKAHMDDGFREVRAGLRQIRGDLGRQSGEMRGEMSRQSGEMARQKDMDARFDQLHRSMQIGFGLLGSVLVALIGLIATQI